MKDISGRQILRFAHLPREVSLVEGLALYDSQISPGYNTMTSVKPDQVVSITDPSKTLVPSQDKPSYELLLCVAKNSLGSLYTGTAYNLEKSDRTAMLAILAGVNQGKDGAQAMLTDGLRGIQTLGTCEIEVNNAM